MPVCFWMVISLSDGDVESKKKSSILSGENFAVFPTKCLYQKLEHLLSNEYVEIFAYSTYTGSFSAN